MFCHEQDEVVREAWLRPVNARTPGTRPLVVMALGWHCTPAKSGVERATADNAKCALAWGNQPDQHRQFEPSEVS